MFRYSWKELSQRLKWHPDKAIEVYQTLLSAYKKGEALSLAEKEYLFSFQKSLLTAPPGAPSSNFFFSLENLGIFEEAAFHSCFTTHWYFHNLTGERNVSPPNGIRRFDLAEEMKFLDSILNKWEHLLNDPATGDRYLIRFRKDRKKLLRTLDIYKTCHLIGYHKFNYDQRFIKLLSYDIHILIQGLIEEEGSDPVPISKEFDMPILITKASLAHILLQHYYPSLDFYRKSKSCFNSDFAPYDLVVHLKSLFTVASEISGPEERSGLVKVDYQYNGGVYRCRLSVERDSSSYYIATMHPLEHKSALEDFGRLSRSSNLNSDIRRVRIHASDSWI